MSEQLNPQFFNTLVRFEKIDKNRLKNLKGASTDIVPTDEKKKLEKYSKLHTTDGFRIDYQFPELKNYGRIKEVPYTGLGTFCKEVRGYLANGVYIDVDMVNCHPVILKSEFNKNGIDCNIINEYITKREEFLKNENVTKEEFLKMVNKEDYETNSQKIRKLHSQIYDLLLPMVIKKNEGLANKVKMSRTYNRNGAVIANYLQDMEFKMLTELYSFCNDEGMIIDVLMHDGFFVRITDRVNENLVNSYIDKFSTLIKEKFDVDMQFKIKQHDTTLLKKIESDTRAEYNKIKDEFEKTNCKIFTKGVFLIVTDGKITTFTRQSLLTAYEHLSFTEGDKRKNFVSEWFKDENIRQYNDIGCYPNKNECPENIFNTWTEFRSEQLMNDCVKQRKEIMLNHMRSLCGDDETVFNWLCKWIGQMIRFPERKSFCPVFVSKQGVGKGTFVDFLARMLGPEKVIESTNPERDVWGQFNGIMETAFLVNINELSKKSTFDAMGRIKSLITDRKIMINKKGMQSYESNSYHRFIMTTNNDDPIETSKDDRRFIIIRSSDRNKGNKDYFKALNDALDNDSVIKECYEYFKSLDGLDSFYNDAIPRTTYQENLTELSLSPIELWLRDLSYSNEKEIKMNNKETFDKFKAYCESNGIKCDMSSVKLGVRMMSIGIDGLVNGRNEHERFKTFNISKLKKHFNTDPTIYKFTD